MPDPGFEVVYLKLLLDRLPSILPIGSPNEFPFKDFHPDMDTFAKTESFPSAVTSVFKMAFGWGTGSEPIAARGPDVTAAADVLAHYLTDKQCLDNLGPITAWVEKLTAMATLAYDKHQIKPVCSRSVLCHTKLTSDLSSQPSLTDIEAKKSTKLKDVEKQNKGSKPKSVCSLHARY